MPRDQFLRKQAKVTENFEKKLKMCCRENGRHLTENVFHSRMLFFSKIHIFNKSFDLKYYVFRVIRIL